MINIKTRYFFISILILLSNFDYSSGKNKVITKKFNWQVCTTEHFDVYFYDEGKNILPFFIETLEKTYREHTNRLSAEIPEKTPVFLYIGHNDFEQTNITEIGEGTEGVTEAFKYRMAVYYNGSKANLEYLIKHEFTHVCQFNILFNGFWKSARLLKFPIYPNWLMEGLAEYSTDDLAYTEREMYLRDATTSGTLLPVQHLHNFSHLKPHYVTLGYKESQAFMQFIAEEYGKEKLVSLLKAYRDKFDADSVLLENIGTNLKTLDRKFRESLEDKYKFSAKDLKEPTDYGKKITNSKTFWTFNTKPIFLSDGKRIIYITDKDANREIVLQEIESGKTTTLVGHKDIDYVEEISENGKGLSLSGDDRFLVFIGEKEQKDYIYVYDLKTQKLNKLSVGFDIINSADISFSGEKIVFIAMQGGYNHIFTCDIHGKNIQKVFSSFENVSDAVFSKDEKLIVFSKEIKTNNPSRPYQRDIYILNLENNQVQQLTNFMFDEFSPCISPDNEIVVFVSDKDGIYNLYAININTKETRKLTNVIGGNFDPSFSNDGKLLAFSSYRHGEKHIYIAEVNNFENKSIFYSKNLQNEIPQESNKKIQLNYRHYRFVSSTDLFFPVLYYSTYDGLFLAFYWQISEMLGNHSASFYTQYISASGLLDYQINYTFSEFRPQFFFTLQGQGGYIDYYGDIYKLEHSQIAGITYPLSRFNSITFAGKNSIYLITDKTIPEKTEKFTYYDHAGIISFSRDTTQAKFIQITKGSRLKITEEIGTDIFGGNYVYQNTKVEINKFIPLGNEHTLANRTLGISSTGPDKYNYTLFRYDRVRTNNKYKNGEYIKPFYAPNILVNNLEWRFPVVNDINYYMWYLFPDFFFRSFYGIVFFDIGSAWEENLYPKFSEFRYCYGIGLQFDTFILQMFYLPLNFYLSYSPINERYEFFFSFGSVF